MAALKVLFSGSLSGDLAGVFKKVETVNRKSGPFDALFCVGQFLGAGTGCAQDQQDGCSKSYVFGR